MNTESMIMDLIYASVIGKKGCGKIAAEMAESYDSAAVYNVGDYCVHGGFFWRCTEEYGPAEWDASKWTSVTVASELRRIFGHLEGIAITTSPSKTAYKYGEVFCPDGMVVTAEYLLDPAGPVTGYTYPEDRMEVGQTEITVAYEKDGVTKTAAQSVTVSKADAALIPDADSVELDVMSPSAVIHVGGEYDGVLSAESDNKEVATASVSGDTVIITMIAEGSATVTVSCTEGANYLAPANADVAVTVAGA